MWSTTKIVSIESTGPKVLPITPSACDVGIMDKEAFGPSCARLLSYDRAWLFPTVPMVPLTPFCVTGICQIAYIDS